MEIFCDHLQKTNFIVLEEQNCTKIRSPYYDRVFYGTPNVLVIICTFDIIMHNTTTHPYEQYV